MYRLVLTLLFLLLLPLASSALTTHGMGDAQGEAQTWWGDAFPGYVVGGCVPPVSATTSLSLPACRAYIREAAGTAAGYGVSPDTQPLRYVAELQARAVTLSGGDGAYAVLLRAQVGVDPLGWTCVAGTHYCWQKLLTPGVPLALPPGTLLLVQAVVSGGAVVQAVGMARQAATPTLQVDCHGLADATDAIEAAIQRIPATGGTVELSGRCLMTREVVIAKSSFTLKGVGQTGIFRGTADPEKSEAGAYIILGANLPGALFRFAPLEDRGTQGNVIRDLGIYGGGADVSSGRLYSVGTAALYIERSDLFTLENVRLVGIRGRALWVANSVRSSFHNLDVTLSGDVDKPSIDIDDGVGYPIITQGSFFTAIRVEQGYGAPYLRVQDEAGTLHFQGVVFESGDDPLTWQTFMDVDGGNRHLISSVSMNNPRASTPALILRNGRNSVDTLNIVGITGGDSIQILGSNNLLTGVYVESNVAVAFDAVEIHGTQNVLSAVYLWKTGGVRFDQPGAVLNVVRDLYQTGGDSYAIFDASNGRNFLYGIHKSGGGHTGRAITLAADDQLIGGELRSMTVLTVGVDANGTRGLIQGMAFDTLAVAVGVSITGPDWRVLGNTFEAIGQHCLQVVNTRPGVIQGNVMQGCSTQTPNTYHGIALVNDTGTPIDTQGVIMGNTIQQGTSDHLASIHVTAGASQQPLYTNLMITNNHIVGGGEADIPPNENNNWVANFNQFYSTPAAATLVAPSFAGFLKINGPGTITTIPLRPPGPPLCLQFAAAATVQEGGNLDLATSPFNAVVGSTMCLQSDGLMWYELSRKP